MIKNHKFIFSFWFLLIWLNVIFYNAGFLQSSLALPILIGDMILIIFFGF